MTRKADAPATVTSEVDVPMRAQVTLTRLEDVPVAVKVNSDMEESEPGHQIAQEAQVHYDEPVSSIYCGSVTRAYPKVLSPAACSYRSSTKL